MFKRKKKKTGCETPELRKPTPPSPPTSGSNAVKPNPNYVPPASVTKSCPYELPCGWCTKRDKKCDKKIGRGDDKPQRGLRVKAGIFPDDAMDPTLKDIILGKGLSRLDTNLDPNKPLPSGIRKEFTND